MSRARGPAWAGALLALGLLLGACGSGGDSTDPATSPTEASTPTPAPSSAPAVTPREPVTPGPSSSAAADGKVEAAIADLAEHLGVDRAEIAVVSHEDVTWPDGSLGCPQPGMSYTQALVPGTRLVLAAGDREYAYHAGRDTPLRRCDNPRPPVDGADRM